MHAVIKIGGSQYLVSEGQEFLVDLQNNPGTQLAVDQVLLISDGDRVQVGKPTVAGYSVICDVLGEIKGEKVHVSKFKAKSRYRKTVGFRPRHTKLKVLSIGTASAVAADSSVSPKTTKTKKVRETKS